MSDLFERLADKSTNMSQRGGEFLQPAPSTFMSVVKPAFGGEEDIDQAGLEYLARPLEAIRQVETHIHETETIIAQHLTPNPVAPPQVKLKAPATASSSREDQATPRRMVEAPPAKNTPDKTVVQPIKIPGDSKQMPILKATPKPQMGDAKPDKTKIKIPSLVADTDPRPAPVPSVESHMQNRGPMRAQSNQPTMKTSPMPPQLKINIGKISVTAPQPKASIAAPVAQSRQPRTSRHNLKEYLGWRR